MTQPIDKIPVYIWRGQEDKYCLYAKDIRSVGYERMGSAELDPDTATFIDQAFEIYDHAQNILKKLAGD